MKVLEQVPDGGGDDDDDGSSVCGFQVEEKEKELMV